MKRIRNICIWVVLLWLLSRGPMLFAATPEPGQARPVATWLTPSGYATCGGVLLVAVMALGTVAPVQRSTRHPNSDANDRDKAGTTVPHQSGSQNVYQEIFEGADDLIYVHDLQGRFQCMNPAGLTLLGYTSQEIELMTLEQVVAPECHEILNRMRGTKLAGDKSSLYELTLVTRDGRRRIVEVSSRLVSKNGQPVAIQSVARDMTEHKHIEAEWTTGNSLLEALLENSPDFIYFKDRESRFVRFSKALLEHYRLTEPVQLKGKTDFDFTTRDCAQQSFKDEQEIIRTGQPILGQLETGICVDGRIIRLKTTKMPWRDKGGTIIGTFGISTNISKLKEAEDKLAAERELLRTLLDNVPERIYFKDRESRFVHASRSKVQKTLERVPQLRTRLAQGAAENGAADPTATVGEELLIGLTDFDMFTEDHARPAYEDEQEIIRTGKPIAGKLEKETHFDGSVTWSLSSKMAWYDKDGNIIGTFGLSRDVTELKKAEAELAAAHKRLLEASRLAGMAEVASDVLHNVGNVLNSVNVSSSLVLERVQETNFTNLAKVPQLLRENVGRLDVFLTTDPRGKHIPEFLAVMAQTIEDQRSFALHELTQLRKHIDHIKHVVNMQQSYAKVTGVEEIIEIAHLVEDALQINVGALDRHQIQLRREIETAPPILMDKHKVLQILVNLIRNAKYALTETERKDKILIVRVRRQGEGHLRVQVIDNGMGIAPENLTRIFGHGFTTRRDGHGFGLHSGALAAREMGGSLSVASEGLGKGATFTLELPIKRHTQQLPEQKS